MKSIFKAPSDEDLLENSRGNSGYMIQIYRGLNDSVSDNGFYILARKSVQDSSSLGGFEENLVDAAGFKLTEEIVKTAA